MINPKTLFFRAISIGVHSELSEEKKLAIKLATLDGYLTAIVTFPYIFDAYSKDSTSLALINSIGFLLILSGIWFIKKRFYDLGRGVLHLVGLSLVFISVDALGINSGIEFYYFVSIAVPFVVFEFSEQWKGNILSAIACVVLLVQQYIGHHQFMAPIPSTQMDKLSAIAFVVFYFVMVFSIGRKQLKITLRDLQRQQKEVFHSSHLISLGEMAAGIAHEVNNPLQSLSLQLMVLRDKAQKDFEEISKMEDTIQKIGKLVQSLKFLSRDTGNDSREKFLFSKVLEDVLIVSSDRIRIHGIQLFVEGDTYLKLSGHPVQISQVLINLLNNSIDAIKKLEDKWIRIIVNRKNSFLEISVTDSGCGISPEVSSKMMNAFFTTKMPSEGTGLGLSISKSIVEKNDGRIYFDESSVNTKFVILLPLLYENKTPAMPGSMYFNG